MDIVALEVMLQAVAVAVIALVAGAVLWVWRKVAVKGVLGPRGAHEKDMLGWRENIGLARTHYAIFSEQGEWGKGKLDPTRVVVYIHGIGAQLHQLTWGVDDGLARSLVDANYTLLAVDLYGHGFSDAPDSWLGPDEFVDQLKALFEHLRITEPVDLIGFSHGSFIACAYAASRPSMVKHLVLTSPFGCDLPGHSWKSVAGFAALIVHLVFEGNVSQLRTIYRVVLHLEGQRLPGFLKAIDASLMQVLVVTGTWDCDPCMGILQTARRIDKSLSKSMLHEIPGGTHMFWATGSPDQQRSFRDLVSQFLDDIASSPENGGPEAPLLGSKTKI